MNTNKHILDISISEFLSTINLDATCWSEATDEVRDLHKSLVDECEIDGDKNVTYVDRSKLNTPLDWNRSYVSGIKFLLRIVSDRAKDVVYNGYKHSLFGVVVDEKEEEREGEAFFNKLEKRYKNNKI